jgi:uncharacterized protein (TIGR02186 family)
MIAPAQQPWFAASRLWAMPGLLITLAATFASLAAARAETLITAVSSYQVAITSSFTGAQLTVFGTVERDGRTIARGDPYDLVVTVLGPRRTIVVRQREQAGPVWVNQSQRRYTDAPSFIFVASNRKIDDIISPDLARREHVGLAQQLIPRGTGFDSDLGDPRFSEALIRLARADRLFMQDERAAAFLTPSLFRAAIPLPAAAPQGTYDVEVVLFAGGVPLARQSTNFEVITTGFEQRIGLSARSSPWLYGLATVVLALGIGWLMQLAFRRE